MKTTYKISEQLKAIIIMLIALIGFVDSSFGQNFTSAAAGSWTTGSRWVGGVAPPVSWQAWGTITVAHDLSITGSYETQAIVNVNSGKTLSISGSLVMTNGKMNVSGTLLVSGSATLIDGEINVLPGGVVIVDGNVTVRNSLNLTVGTNANPPPYADLVIKGDLISNASGRILIDKNGRLAIFGDYKSDNVGGAKLTLSNGGQVYIDGNISLTNSSDKVTNGVSTTPIGLYVNGTSTGGTIPTNKGTKATMKTNDLPFYNWVLGLAGSPLPITLTFFKVTESTADGVKLNWATAFEKNFDKFVIERSADGITFKTISEIAGSGNSSIILNYSFTDESPLTGSNTYYRLKSVDFDGSSEYSKIVFTVVEGAKEVSMYPNPSNGESITYQSNFTPNIDDSIVVLDVFGSQIATASALSTNGNITFNTKLKSGTYLVKFTSTDYQKIERIVVK